jgi:hypothetical protein
MTARSKNHNEKLHEYYVLQVITTLFKGKEMKWFGCREGVSEIKYPYKALSFYQNFEISPQISHSPISL